MNLCKIYDIIRENEGKYFRFCILFHEYDADTGHQKLYFVKFGKDF